MTKIEQAKKKMDEALEEMRSLGKDGLCEALRELTKDLPLELISIGWNQYTTYFNDGDECTFSVHAYSECMKFNGTDGDYLKEENKELYDILFVKGKKGYDEDSPALKTILDFLSQNEEFLKQAIGDHSEVTYYRAHAEGGERIVVEDYTDHD